MRTMPKDVVQAIEGYFPWTRGDWRSHVTDRSNFQWLAPVMLPGILEMVDRIPGKLLVFDSDTYSQFTLAVLALRRSLQRQDSFTWPQFPVPGQTVHEDCLVMVKNILGKCPDEAPSKSTKGLLFISDQSTRDVILIDLGSAEVALRNAEWKAATVLSGSVIEAVLYWVLKQKSQTEIATAIRALGS
jgi:hypothetical protein